MYSPQGRSRQHPAHGVTVGTGSHVRVKERRLPLLTPDLPTSQGKTVIQAEIDAAAELIDFFRFNAKFAVELEGEQPISVPPSTNSVVYRGLEVPTRAGEEGLPDALGLASPPPLSPGLCGGHLPL